MIENLTLDKIVASSVGVGLAEMLGSILLLLDMWGRCLFYFLDLPQNRMPHNDYSNSSEEIEIHLMI